MTPREKRGFADLSLGPLGYRAESLSIANLPRLSRYANRGQHLPSLLFLSGRRRGNFRLAQEACSFFRRRGIDVEAGTPFKARHFGQLRDDLDMPMVVIVDLFADRRSVDHKVVCRTIQNDV